MSLLSEFLSNTFIYSFGWTLLHSLWHGAIISFLTLLILFFLRKQSSSIRYQISVISMLVVVILSVWTFISLYGYFTNIFSGNNAKEAFGSISNNSYGIFWFDLFPEPVKQNIQYFTPHLPLVLTVWFVAVLFLSVKYLGAYIYSQRLKHTRIKAVKGYWIDKLNSFSNQLNLRRPIELFESAIIKVPMVIGYFKPVILVPLGLFSGIPQEQIEAILIHELAHIKRNDYLVKLLQTIVEILFFFNPFVWWISSIINKEREHSCDDLAISITKDNISFVRALAGLCELEVDKSNMALAFGKSNNQIIKRMERIMKRNENKNSFSHFTIAIAILLTSLIALGAVSIKGNEEYNNSNETQIIIQSDVEQTLDAPIVQQDEKIVKIKEEMKKLKMAYENTDNPEKKKKLKQMMVELEKKAKWSMKEKESVKEEKVNKKELQKKVQYLEQELAKTKDETKKKELEKKIWALKKKADDAPPPPPKN
ncbi:MAG: M56 family metallopeptidase [Melioribacteraceae bacterium]|nr:M56 family metallopeptidase [Melioribacteraceae bacterium]